MANVKKEMVKRNTDPVLVTIFVKGIMVWRNHTPFNITNLDPQYRKLVQEQDCIGWKQIFNGRWSKSWATLQERHNNETGNTNSCWGKQILTSLWNQWEKVWNLQNEVQHRNDPEDKVRIQTENAKAELELKSIYDNKKLYVPSDRNFLLQSYETHLESKKLYQIENWLQYYRGVFKRSIKEAQKTSITNTKSMQKYFVTTHKAEKKRRRPQQTNQNKKRQKLFKSAWRLTNLRLTKYFSPYTSQHKERNPGTRIMAQ